MEPLQLETIRADVWQWLSDALAERTHPFFISVVANVDESGQPRARVVVLRAADAEGWTLDFHTDTRSPKYASLRRHGALTWLFWDPAGLLQVRADGEASLHTDDALANASWTLNALASRAPYMGSIASGEPVDAPEPAVIVEDDAHSLQGRPHFCVVRCAIRAFDVLQLHPSGHRRAIVRPDEQRWVAP